jgi:hypothetical protein
MKFKSPKTEIRQEKRVERTIADAAEKIKPAKHNIVLCM